MEGLKKHIRKVCKEQFLCAGGEEDNEDDAHGIGSQWLDKILQLYQITNLNHGLMMVGPSGSGKSSAWRVLLKALEEYEGTDRVDIMKYVLHNTEVTLFSTAHSVP